MDATSLGNRWTILAGSWVSRGCAIPVAWKGLAAQQEGSWRPSWEGLLNELGQVECFVSKKGRINGTLLMRLPTRR